MKTEILKYLETDRSYRGGVSLVIKYSSKLGLKKQLNIHPQSDYLKGCIIEELRELAGLKIAELKIILSTAVKAPAREVKPSPMVDDSVPIAADDEYLSRFPATASSIPEEDDLNDSADDSVVIKSKKVKGPVKKQSRKR